MKINTKTRYEEKYLPTKRHRIPRIRQVEETTQIEIREITGKDAPVAMVVTDYQSYVDGNGENQFGLRDTALLAISDQLFAEKRDMRGTLDRGPYSLERLLEDAERMGDCIHSWRGKDKESILRSLKEFADSHVFIDGVIYEQVSEPRYVVQTFGLGHNHGGTAMSIHFSYNSNISKANYFNALHREEAIAYAAKVATNRGDTESLGKFGDINIAVHMPELVRCDPAREHVEGDPFMNTLESLIQGSDSATEAGLLAIAVTMSEVSGGKRLSLSSQINSAEARTQTTEPAPAAEIKVKETELDH